MLIKFLRALPRGRRAWLEVSDANAGNEVGMSAGKTPADRSRLLKGRKNQIISLEIPRKPEWFMWPRRKSGITPAKDPPPTAGRLWVLPCQSPARLMLLFQPKFSLSCQNLDSECQLFLDPERRSRPPELINLPMPKRGGLSEETNYCGLFEQSQCLGKEG